MAQSTRSRRALKALGSGGSANIVPVVSPALPRATLAPTLSRAAKARLRWFDYAHTHPPHRDVSALWHRPFHVLQVEEAV